jgi:hypothetical protein
MSNYLKNLVQ